MITARALVLAAIVTILPFGAQAQEKALKLLVHVTTGADNPTKAALAFLVAKSAADEGHQVTMFLAGDGAELITDKSLDSVVGRGTGKLRESYDALVVKGTRIFISGGSAKARGSTESDIAGKPAQFAMPNTLVKLVMESDRTITY